MKISDRITERDIEDAERIETDPEMILRLIDLIFLGADESKNIPS